MRLLLVEDEDARMIAKGLREQTYAVDIATTGPDAIDKTHVNKYDLILLDVMLPGLDDYLTKPFDFGVLTARVRALLRRGPALIHSIFTVADLHLDTRKREVRRRDRLIPLTAKEYALLEFLARQQGTVIGRAEISEHVWDETYDPFSNLIEVYMQRLRRKIELPGDIKLLHTRRGGGSYSSVESSPRT